MRRYPDRVSATELAQAQKLKPNTLSIYVSALMQAGPVTQERVGTSLRYSIHMKAARETFDYLLRDCCRGRPEICSPLTSFSFDGDSPVTDRKYNVLFICTGMVTNVGAGWIAARFGLTSTLYAGLGIQVLALLALAQLDPT